MTGTTWPRWSATPAIAAGAWGSAVSGLARAVLPIFGAVLLAAIAVNLAQVGFLFLPSRVQLDFSHLDPFKGARRLFSMHSLARLVFGLFKLAVVLGVALIALQWPIVTVYLALMDGSAAVEDATAGYFQTRIWGAPAALTLFACSGLLIGLGRSRELLFVQLLLNGLNAGLDIWFAGYLGMGVRGIGVGTAIAEWSTCAVAALVLWRTLRARHRDAEPFLPLARIRDGARLRRMMAANGDIMLRTLCLLAGFGWFASQGARLGDVTLAANHLLLQLVSFSAFFLDGYAFVAEAQVGAAAGARDRARLQRVVRVSSELAAATAVVLALAIWLAGGAMVALLTSLPDVAATARAFLPWTGLYVLLSVAAFQLDGIFIGATLTNNGRSSKGNLFQ